MLRLSTPSALALIFCLCCLALPAAAADDADTGVVVRADALLGAAPRALELPAFHDEKPGAFGVDDLLAVPGPETSRLRPVAGADGWSAGGEAMSFSGPGVSETWLATYVTADRWLKATARLTVETGAKAWLDGESVDLSGDRPSGEIELEPGTSLLLFRLLVGDDPASTETTSLDAGIELVLPEGADPAAVSFGATESRAVDIRDVLDAPKVSSLAVSPDGKLVLLSLGAYDHGDHRESWLEIRDTKDGALVDTWRGGREPSSPQWRPDGGAFSFTERDDDTTTIWLYDLETRDVRPLAAGLADFRGYRWNPDGRSLVYAFGVDAEKDERGVKRLEGIEDRWPWYRDRSYLVEISLVDGRRRRLTAGSVSAGSWGFDAEGTHLLFARTFPAPTRRPYSRTEWYEMDLGDLAVVRVLAEEESWLDSVIYGPDRETLIVTGSPSAFDGLGRDLPDGVTPNDYGGQLYVYDRGRGEARPLTRDFDPTVQQVVWHRPSRSILARVLDGQDVRLAVFGLDGRRSPLEDGVDVVGDWDAARDANVVVCEGTDADAPQTVHALEVGRRGTRLLLDPGAARYDHVTFGRVEPFVATLPDGMRLDGRVHYPRDYEPGRKYPVIVYYYGGTYPITNDFGGRYPKNVWAGQGYFVYVPNPSGALGYGQEYAARHVNDWGERTAREVIEGTQAFLAAYPDADGERMGCIGASYGGFLTMDIVTKTDIFAAAVSHAGISNIASYWAEGYWGYAYGARALADAFPWSDPQIYVDRSALYHADRITTPLLLLHGFVDTNVPKGESDGLYIALKMLERDVEYVQIADQDHHILDHDKRIVWNDTILAWFAWKLKDRPDWWHALYPERE